MKLNKKICALLTTLILLSRYCEARGKRSTIVTARVTRKAKRRLTLTYYVFYRRLYHLRIYDAYMFALDSAFLALNHFFRYHDLSKPIE